MLTLHDLAVLPIWLPRYRRGKVPIDMHTGRPLRDWTNPDHHRTLPQLRQDCPEFAYGLVPPAAALPSGHHLLALDLDHVRDPETDSAVPWAENLIPLTRTYVEISQSGTGLHILGLSEVSVSARSLTPDPINHPEAKLEICTGQFLAMTFAPDPRRSANHLHPDLGGFLALLLHKLPKVNGPPTVDPNPGKIPIDHIDLDWFRRTYRFEFARYHRIARAKRSRNEADFALAKFACTRSWPRSMAAGLIFAMRGGATDWKMGDPSKRDAYLTKTIGKIYRPDELV